MTNFVLRELDDALWKRVKVKAAEDGVTIKSVVVGLLDRWSDGRLAVAVGVPALYRGGNHATPGKPRKPRKPRKGRTRG